jgi:hypothetical protein
MLIAEANVKKLCEGADIKVTKEFLEILNYKIGGFVIKHLRSCKLKEQKVLDITDLGE